MNRQEMVDVIQDVLRGLGPGDTITTSELGVRAGFSRLGKPEQKRAYRMLADLRFEDALRPCWRPGEPKQLYGQTVTPPVWHRPALARPAAPIHQSGLDPAKVASAIKHLSLAFGGGEAVDAVGYAMEDDDPTIDPVHAAAVLLINIHMADIFRAAGLETLYQQEVRNARPA